MGINVISNSEWEIMRIVWTKAPITSTVIIDDLEASKGWKPTTVKTFLSRLVKKEMLKYEINGRNYFYSPLVSEEECVQDELQSVISKVYGGIIYEQTKHFELRGNPDILYMKRIAEALENSYNRMTTILEVSLDHPIQVYVHTAQRRLHSALGLLEGPKWLRTGHMWGMIHLAPEECFDDISAENASVHTFIILLIQMINPSIPYWLQQAVSTYYSGWMTKEKIIALNYDFLDFPTLTKRHGMLASYVSFKEIHGYEWGYTVTNYVINRYGVKQLADFLRKPFDFVGVFGVTEEHFWKEWRDSLTY